MAAALVGAVTAGWLSPETLDNHSLLLAMAISAGMLCLLGCWDDRFQLRARWKLVGQILAALPVLAAGHYIHRVLVLGNCLELGPFGPLVTLGWLVLGINALNLLDGMDGLASFTGIVMALAVAAVAWCTHRMEVTMVALVLAGAISGFLIYNLPPARIYLGDCGSMMIGFVLALLAQEASLVNARTVHVAAKVAVAAAILFVPLLDTGLAIVRRRLKGLSLAEGDRSHVHHQLLDRGFSAWAALGLLGGLSALGGVVAWLAAVWQQGIGSWAVLGVVVAIAVRRQLLAQEEWQLARAWLRQLVLGPVTARPEAAKMSVALRIAPETAAAPFPDKATSQKTIRGVPGGRMAGTRAGKAKAA